MKLEDTHADSLLRQEVNETLKERRVTDEIQKVSGRDIALGYLEVIASFQIPNL